MLRCEEGVMGRPMVRALLLRVSKMRDQFIPGIKGSATVNTQENYRG
jgi:hypothetical protein